MARKSNLGGLLALLVFAVFAVCILMVLLMGADIVSGISERDAKSADERTAALYISNKIHQADHEGMVSVREFDGQSALVLAREIDGYMYETVIYCHEGYLCEMFAEQGYLQEPQFGQKILPLESFSAKDEGTHITVTLGFEETAKNVTVALRSERSGL